MGRNDGCKARLFRICRPSVISRTIFTRYIEHRAEDRTCLAYINIQCDNRFWQCSLIQSRGYFVDDVSDRYAQFCKIFQTSPLRSNREPSKQIELYNRIMIDSCCKSAILISVHGLNFILTFYNNLLLVYEVIELKRLSEKTLSLPLYLRSYLPPRIVSSISMARFWQRATLVM